MVDFNWSDNVIERAPIRARTVAASLSFLRRGRRSFNTPYNLSFNSRLSVAFSFSTRVAASPEAFQDNEKMKPVVWTEIRNFKSERQNFISSYLFMTNCLAFDDMYIVLLKRRIQFLQYRIFSAKLFLFLSYLFKFEIILWLFQDFNTTLTTNE